MVTEHPAKKDWADCLCQMIVDIKAEFPYFNSKVVLKSSYYTCQPTEQVL